MVMNRPRRPASGQETVTDARRSGPLVRVRYLGQSQRRQYAVCIPIYVLCSIDISFLSNHCSTTLFDFI